MKKSTLLPFNLQLFAASEGAEGAVDTQEAEATEAVEEEKESVAKYTDEDVNRIIDKKFAEWTKKAEKKALAEREAEKLKSLSGKEKIEALEAQLAHYQERERHASMLTEAQSYLKQLDASLNLPTELIEPLVVDSDAEKTKAAIQTFATTAKQWVDDEVKRVLKGKAPVVRTASREEERPINPYAAKKLAEEEKIKNAQSNWG